MKSKIILTVVFFILCNAGFSQEMITLPWKEFKDVYKEHILKKIEPEKVKKRESIISLTMADYDLSIHDENATLKVNICGKIIEGASHPVKLFPKGAVISDKIKVTNAEIIKDKDGIYILPDDKKEFNVSLVLLLNFREDSISQHVGLKIPDSLQNKISISLSDNIKLLKYPGIKTLNGDCYFPSDNEFCIRFCDKDSVGIRKKPMVDVLTQFEFKNDKVDGRTHLFVSEKSSRSFVIQIPVDYNFLSTSIKKSWYKFISGNKIAVNIPERKKSSFSISFSVPVKDNSFQIKLPSIENNSGREGDLTLKESDEIELIHSDNFLKSRMVDKYYTDLFNSVKNKNSRFFFFTPGNKPTIKIRRLAEVKSPETVIDALYFFTAFEENGRSLSILKFKYPQTSKRRLALKQIHDAEIWYLKVNGQNKKVFSLDNENWMIPLEQNRESHVELAFIKKSGKLGINGKLDSVMSATGMASGKLYYAIALPERLELISIDGPLSPVEERKKWNISNEFSPNRYFFYRSFYKGEEVKVSLFYQEPKK